MQTPQDRQRQSWLDLPLQHAANNWPHGLGGQGMEPASNLAGYGAMRRSVEWLVRMARNLRWRLMRLPRQALPVPLDPQQKAHDRRKWGDRGPQNRITCLLFGC